MQHTLPGTQTQQNVADKKEKGVQVWNLVVLSTCCSSAWVHRRSADYSDKPKTVVMQYMVLFSHLTVRLPSELLSQKQDAAVCSPAPAFAVAYGLWTQ